MICPSFQVAATQAYLPPPPHELPLLLALRVLVVLVPGDDGRVGLEHGRQAVLRERDVRLGVCEK